MKGAGKSIIFPRQSCPCFSAWGCSVLRGILQGWNCSRSHTEPGESQNPTGQGKGSRGCPREGFWGQFGIQGAANPALVSVGQALSSRASAVT